MGKDDSSQTGRRGKTAIVGGKEMDADVVAAVHEVREVFAKFQKGMKQILLYRHNRDRYPDYLADTLAAFNDFTTRRGQMQLRVAATEYFYQKVTVYEDESRDHNLCYPFYAHGVRMLIINAGLTMDELIRFLLLIFTATEVGVRHSEDFVTRLWKAELQSIQYIVVEGFKALEDEDAEDVQMEVEKVVAYLYRQMQSNTDDVARFARVDTADLDMKLTDVDQMRGAIITGVTATGADKERIGRALHDEEQNRLLPKMVIILFQLLELATDEKNYEDVSEAFVQLLDAMLLAERFDVITQILDRFDHAAKKNLKPHVRTMVQSCRELFNIKMGEQQRLIQLTQMLNAGPVKDPQGMQRYLMMLAQDALVPLLDALERVEVPNNRRMLCDVIADMARSRPESVANRLSHPSSNVVKDMMYILDRINPPNKLELIATLLDHSNLVLRLETINTLGRTPSDKTLPYIVKTLKGPDSQMRAAAARVIHLFEPERAATELLHQAAADDFLKRPKEEQKAILGAVAQVNHPKCQQYIQHLMAAKGTIFNRARVEESKQLMVDALAAVVGVPTLQQLANWAQDPTLSKELQTAARNAALEMRNKLLGNRPAGA